jgi:dTDP-4-amino-4,6-dideoxygalactose transaminase
MSVSNQQIYLSPPHMSGREMKYIQEAFDQNWIAPMGPNVDKFEKSLAEYCGVKYVTALSSGTAAIHLALIVLGVEAGDEVIASTFTFSATINPIVYQGALPILVDCEPGTWNMDPEILETAIKDRMSKGKKPKAIIPVHLYGMPANMSEIMTIANKFDIPVIEDAAEALGSKYKNKRLGSYGKLGILSFNGNKIITTSGGGALISNQEKLIKRARYLATQARDMAPHYQHSAIGYNYRMSNIVAGIGRGQLEVIEKRVQRRRVINKWYRNLLADIPGITFNKEPSDEFFSNCWLTCIVIYPEKAGTERKKLQLTFDAENIETRPLWKPMHLQPVFAGSPAYVNGTSEKLFQNGLCLPSGSNLTEMELSRISEILISELHIQ